MSLKISGVELVRRFKEKAPEYKAMAEHCIQHADDIKRKVDEISGIAGVVTGHVSMQMVPSPDMIWQSRAEACKARADDLIWLSGAIVENQIHEITVEEMTLLGIIGTLNGTDLESGCGSEESD